MNEPLFDWTDNADVAAMIGTQLTVGIAGLVNQGHDESELINGFIAGRYAFNVTRDGVTLLEATGKEIDQ
jgi:hypothetical protein